MACNTRIVHTSSSDPWWNLAVGEYLLEQASQDETILYLWHNDSTVVVGRNQDPYRECRTDLLEGDGGRLARRFSDGEAVYQDLGSLNFAFIAGNDSYDPDRQFEALLKAAKSLGIAAERCGEFLLAADGRSFSDSVFYFTDECTCHHGTIHVSTDMDKLARYLYSPSENIFINDIRPAGLQIVNLSELKPGLDATVMAGALIEAFREVYDSTAQVEISLRKCSESREALEELYCKYSSWAWRYCQTAELVTSVKAMAADC